MFIILGFFYLGVYLFFFTVFRELRDNVFYLSVVVRFAFYVGEYFFSFDWVWDKVGGGIYGLCC